MNTYEIYFVKLGAQSWELSEEVNLTRHNTFKNFMNSMLIEFSPHHFLFSFDSIFQSNKLK